MTDYDPTPGDTAIRQRAERLAREGREDARHEQLLAVGGLVTAIAQLHSPDEVCRECDGCDFGGYAAERPEWPCRTWELLDETAPR